MLRVLGGGISGGAGEGQRKELTEEDVEAVHLDESFCIDGVGEAYDSDTCVQNMGDWAGRCDEPVNCVIRLRLDMKSS